jgi:hypothetical protein
MSGFISQEPQLYRRALLSKDKNFKQQVFYIQALDARLTTESPGL